MRNRSKLCLPKGRAGFSIIELLVALAILGFVAAGLSQALRLGIATLARVDASVSQQNVSVARSLLRTWIETAVHPAQSLPFSTNFHGGAGDLSFMSMSLMDFAGDGVALQVSIHVSDETSAIEVAVIGQSGQTLDEYRLPLSVQGASLELSYFDARSGRWLEAWNDDGRLPDLVRIVGSPEETWPEFLARPRVGPRQSN